MKLNELATELQVADNTISTETIVARMERIPPGRWFRKLRLTMGMATFFDAFDSLAIAAALPALSAIWHLKPTDMGVLISVGYAGQLLGALVLGRLAEARGRTNAALISVAIFTLFSALCALAPSYTWLCACRFLQGVGLGGEVPIAAAYINEFSRAKGRGRSFVLYEASFTLGLVFSSLVGAWIVPQMGWRVLLALGAVPAVIILWARRSLPESPRWLAEHGRLAEADEVVSRIERSVEEEGKTLPQPAKAVSRRAPVRTRILTRMSLVRSLSVWAMWFACYFLSYGVGTWAPTILRTALHLPLQQALLFSFVLQTLYLCGTLGTAVLVDRLGRKIYFRVAFAGVSVALFCAYSMVGNQIALMALIAGAFVFNAAISVTLYLYTPEIYPTTVRAKGSAFATSFARLASITSPLAIGAIMQHAEFSQIFLMLGLVALLIGGSGALFVTETRNCVLEDIPQ